MKFAVFSDSHTASGNVSRIINACSDCDAFIFLGDGYYEAKNIIENSGKKFYCVKGNCDSGSLGLDEEMEVSTSGKRIFICHGHRYHVKWGLNILSDEGSRRNADVILYGHTHTADESYQNGIYILNPGAASGYNASYGILEVRNNGILFSIVPLI